MHDADAMKLARDGHLGYGPKREHRWLRPVLAVIGRAENGNTLTTDGGCGVIEWSAPTPDGTRDRVRSERA
jgi:hypothetical protein